MSMTREEAIAILSDWDLCHHTPSKEAAEAVISALDPLDIIAALLHQIWEERLWHDAKTDPPTKPGLYYGKKDDTNSMYACRYRDGVWVLNMYPQTKMDIVQWADYTAFVREVD